MLLVVNSKCERVKTTQCHQKLNLIKLFVYLNNILITKCCLRRICFNFRMFLYGILKCNKIPEIATKTSMFSLRNSLFERAKLHCFLKHQPLFIPLFVHYKNFQSLFFFKTFPTSNLSELLLYPNFHPSIRRGENPSTTTNTSLLPDLIISQFMFSSCVMNTEGLSYLKASRIISLLAFTHGIKAEEIQTWLNHFLGLLKIADSTKN